MKYKVGDKVRIRENLEAGKTYGKKMLLSTMEKYLGYEATIKAYREESGYYVLDKDAADGHWGWSEEMLEPVTDCDFKIGDKVIFKNDEGMSAGVFTIKDTTKNGYYIKLEEKKMNGNWFRNSRFLKVPLFKVGQIVQFKNIKEDKWYPDTIEMAEIESELGVVEEVKENHYTADKPYQDGCLYAVKALPKGETWHVTSASLRPVVSTAVSTLEDVKSVSQDDPGPIGDDGVLAIAQAVDNVKGPQFKIGDRILIREDLVPGKKYEEWDYSPEDGMGGWEFAAVMAKYMGKVATITGYIADDPNYYRLDIDKGTYSWIVNALLPYTPGSDYDLDKQIINQQTKQNYENRLQREKARISRGDKYTGRAVCSRGCKAQITVGHLSYKEVTQ